MRSRMRLLTCLVCLVVLMPVADAQRRSSQRDAGQFEGTWRGSLTMDVLFDVPAEQVERLSQPVELEIRIFGRGNAELYFFGDTEWDFREQRDFRITPVGEDNAVLLARISNTAGRWRSSFAFSFAKQGPDQLLVNWSRMTIRNQVENDGLDHIAFAGVAVFDRTDD